MGKSLIIKGADFSSVAVEQVTFQGSIAINVVPSIVQGGTVTGSGLYNKGDNVQITATPNTNFVFVRWDDGNTNAMRTITVGGMSETYTAIFAVDTTVDIQLDLGTSQSGYYYCEENDAVAVKPNSDWFIYAELDVSLFAGRRLEINGVSDIYNAARSMYLTSDGTIELITPTSATIYQNNPSNRVAGPASVVLPDNVTKLYLCYCVKWKYVSDDSAFEGVTAVIKAVSD